MRDMLVIGIVGLPGSGKSTVADVASIQGWVVLSMGDIVRQFASELGVEPTAENLGKLALQIRREHGPTIIAEQCIERAEALRGTRIIIEGLRTLDELRLFKAQFKHFHLLTVFTPEDQRFLNLCERRREDDPKGFDKFRERDQREERLGLCKVMREAEYVVVNDSDLDTLRRQTNEVLRRVTGSES